MSYPKVCCFEYLVQISDIMLFESIGSHAKSSEVIFLHGGGET